MSCYEFPSFLGQYTETGNYRMMKIHAEDEHNLKVLRNEYGDTLLILAAKGGSVKCLDFYVKSGLDPEAANNVGVTALMTAVMYDNFACVKYLVEECEVDVNTENDIGYIALTYAVSNLKFVKYLVRNGADICRLDKNGHDALWHARNDGVVAVVEYLAKMMME